jgi:hypothetical protein
MSAAATPLAAAAAVTFRNSLSPAASASCSQAAQTQTWALVQVS